MKYRQIKYFQFILAALIMLSMTACADKFLSEKPDGALAVPHSAKDLQAILDYVARINDLNPGLAELGSDNFFLPFNTWQEIATEENRDSYIWKSEPVHLLYWSYMYQKIYYINTVIQYLDGVEYVNQNQKNELRGQAYFLRGMTFHKLTEVFCTPYDRQSADQKMGIVLKMSPDINEQSVRSNLEATYQQIIDDLQVGIRNLSDQFPDYPTRPSKAAAYGALARCFLSMRDYSNAYDAADEALALRSKLVDHNELNKNTKFPFPLYNQEVIYHSRAYTFGILTEARARVDTSLYDMYNDKDLRKELYFTNQNDKYQAFTGDYSNLASGQIFDGITTAEMFLIRAECNARTGTGEQAMDDLGMLYINRYDTAFDITELAIPTDKEGLIDWIITERRKELLGRGLRWSDIRRLSFDDSRKVNLKRNLNGQLYSLSADQIRDFSFYIPRSVIELSGIPQNR